MEAVKIFASTTGLRPYSLNRTSFTLAITIATLVIAKFIDGYLFCGFNRNFYVDLLIGVVLFAGCCVIPLLRWAIKGRVKLCRECCQLCRVLLIAYAGFGCATCVLCVSFLSLLALYTSPDVLPEDPFNICGNRTFQAVKAQFSNAMPTFELAQRIDHIFKLLIAIGWFLPSGFIAARFGCFLADAVADLPRADNQADLEAGNLDNNGASAVAEQETINAVSDQPATIDIDDESAPGDAIREVEEERRSEVGSDAEMENRRSEANEPGNDAQPQFEEAE